MKIGLVTDFYFPWIAGPSAVVRNLGHGLARRGHQVFLLAPSPTGGPYEEQDGPMTVRRVPTVRSPFGYKLRTSFWPLASTRTWLKDVEPDIVNVHHPFPLSAAALLLSRRRHIPVVATNHTIPECTLWGIRDSRLAYPVAHALFAHWLDFLLRGADRVCTPTHTAARYLQPLSNGPPTVVSNGIDTDRFSPGPVDLELRERLGLDDRPIVLYTGRLDPDKQMDVWLEAAARVAMTLDAQFLIGGNGTDRKRLERRVQCLGLEDRVRFVGYLEDAVYPQIYRLAMAYCITSPVELQSISTLEAIASGLPVVAVRAGALPELVRDGENGYCVEPGNSNSVAIALERLLCDTGTHATMGRLSRRIAQDHSLERTVDAYDRILKDVASQHRGDRRVERAPATGW